MSACACPGVCGSELAAAALRRQRAEELQGEQRAGSSAMDRHGKRSTCLRVAWPGVKLCSLSSLALAVMHKLC